MKIPTIRQARLIKLFIENYGKSGAIKTLRELLLQAGYSEESAVNPHTILEGEAVQKGIKSFVDQLEDKRRRAITHITEEKLRGEKALNLAYITDIFTKNIQLLGGEATERISVQLDQTIADKNNVAPRKPENNSG